MSRVHTGFHAALTTIIDRMDSVVALAILAGVLSTFNHYSLSSVNKGILGEVLSARISLLHAAFAVFFVVLWKGFMDYFGMYRTNQKNASVAFLTAFVACSGAALTVFAYLHYMNRPDAILKSIIFLAFTYLYESSRILFGNMHLVRPTQPQYVIILGTGRRASKAWRELRMNPGSNKVLLGFVDNRDTSSMPPDIAERYLGTAEDLPEFLLHNVVDELIVATPMRTCYDMTQRAVSIAEAVGVHVSYINDIFNLSMNAERQSRTEVLLDLLPQDEIYIFSQKIKRLMDLVGASLALLAAMPLMLIIAMLVKATSRGPVIFVQQRFGYGRRRYPMFKFRSMVQNASHLMENLEAKNEASGPIFKMSNDPRVTPLGKFLRKTSLDELPQLFNVLLGDMSLVGPRPMSVRDVSFFNDARYMRRFSVRPGITGQWQVSARGSLEFEDWIKYDCYYIDHWSILLDLKILARTVPAVLSRAGAV